MKVIVIGANGFVGSAFVRLFKGIPDVKLVAVTRETFEGLKQSGDVVINASCNPRKYLADEQPLQDIDATVKQTLKVLLNYPAGVFIQISTVDVYGHISSPETTREDCTADVRSECRYGFHKLIAEQLVKYYAPRWLVLRSAGMVGPGLKKGPVFDILNGEPLRIHPTSEYQFLSTDDIARIAWELFCRGFKQEIFNVCGDGRISMHEIADMAGVFLGSEQPPLPVRVVNVNTDKLWSVLSVPSTMGVVKKFVSTYER